MRIAADLHTHTLLCRHAYSTVTEVIQAASDRGLQGVGLTEHGPGYPGSVGWAYFNTYRDIPRTMGRLQVFCGAEANLMGLDGALDFTPEQLAKLDLVIASCHRECTPAGSREENTRMLLQAMENPGVDIMGHPDNPLYPIEAELLAREASRLEKALEINNSSPAARPGSEPICRELLLAAKKYKTLLGVGSDAHYHLKVGCFDYSLGLLQEMEIPEEQVVNSSMERLNQFLSRHRQVKNSKK